MDIWTDFMQTLRRINSADVWPKNPVKIRDIWKNSYPEELMNAVAHLHARI